MPSRWLVSRGAKEKGPSGGQVGGQLPEVGRDIVLVGLGKERKNARPCLVDSVGTCSMGAPEGGRVRKPVPRVPGA